MRLSPPRKGFALAWHGELAESGEDDTRRRPMLDSALNAAGASSTVRADEWAPITPELLSQIRDGLQQGLST